MNKLEVWKDIKGYEGLYQISNFGNVKSVERKVQNKNGMRIVKEKLLKPSISNKGYYMVALCKNCNQHTYTIHKLVIRHFNRNPIDNEVINHKDNNKLNNKIDNLEYISQKENVKDAWKNGLCEIARNKAKENILKASEKNKIKINQFDIQGNFIKQWEYMRQIQNELGISNANIVKCCKGERKTAGGYIWKYN